MIILSSLFYSGDIAMLNLAEAIEQARKDPALQKIFIEALRKLQENLPPANSAEVLYSIVGPH